jgi:hypothetical protein
VPEIWMAEAERVLFFVCVKRAAVSLYVNRRAERDEK